MPLQSLLRLARRRGRRLRALLPLGQPLRRRLRRCRGLPSRECERLLRGGRVGLEALGCRGGVLQQQLEPAQRCRDGRLDGTSRPRTAAATPPPAAAVRRVGASRSAASPQ